MNVPFMTLSPTEQWLPLSYASQALDLGPVTDRAPCDRQKDTAGPGWWEGLWCRSGLVSRFSSSERTGFVGKGSFLDPATLRRPRDCRISGVRPHAASRTSTRSPSPARPLAKEHRWPWHLPAPGEGGGIGAASPNLQSREPCPEDFPQGADAPDLCPRGQLVSSLRFPRPGGPGLASASSSLPCPRKVWSRRCTGRDRAMHLAWAACGLLPVATLRMGAQAGLGFGENILWTRLTAPEFLGLLSGGPPPVHCP